MGLFRLEKKNVRGSITASKCQEGRAVQAMWHRPRLLGDRDGVTAAGQTDSALGGFYCPCCLRPLELGSVVSRGLYLT